MKLIAAPNKNFVILSLKHPETGCSISSEIFRNKMSNSLRRQALSLYRDLLRIGRNCQLSDCTSTKSDNKKFCFQRLVVRLTGKYNPSRKDRENESKYIISETKKAFLSSRNLSNEIHIREKLQEGDIRIKLSELYGDPYPRDMRDRMRVLKMGAGYTKRGRMHQKWEKRGGKFHSHDRRREIYVRGWSDHTAKYQKHTRIPGTYQMPTFDQQEQDESTKNDDTETTLSDDSKDNSNDSNNNSSDKSDESSADSSNNVKSASKVKSPIRRYPPKRAGMSRTRQPQQQSSATRWDVNQNETDDNTSDNK